MADKFGVLVDDNQKNFPMVTGYLHFIKGPISHVSLLTLAHVLQLSCQYFDFLLTFIKNCVTKIVKQFSRGMVKIYFGLLKI